MIIVNIIYPAILRGLNGIWRVLHTIILKKLEQITAQSLCPILTEHHKNICPTFMKFPLDDAKGRSYFLYIHGESSGVTLATAHHNKPVRLHYFTFLVSNGNAGDLIQHFPFE